MSSKLYTVTVDCSDPARLADFWGEVLGYRRGFESDEEVEIEAPDGSGATVLFLKAPDTKTVKNRIHFDLDPDDQEAEVERCLALGARRADIGQSDVNWVVLADPEGNEFCILTPRTD
ncbi:MAG: VOC family protein [Actinomycetota bacterium]|nr:VOC family protein [Actinomycetota bacterium]